MMNTNKSVLSLSLQLYIYKKKILKEIILVFKMGGKLHMVGQFLETFLKSFCVSF